MENQLRELLHDIADQVPPQREVPPSLRPRARRRIAVTVGMTVVLVGVVTIGGVAAVRSMVESLRLPADTGPTVEPAGAEVLNVRAIVDPESLPDPTVALTDAAWSPDRQWIAFRVRGGRSPATVEPSLWVADVATGTPREVNPDIGWFPWAWSPIENRLAFVRGRDVVLLDAATGRETDLGTMQPPLPPEEDSARLVWSSDGTRIVYDGGDGSRGTVYAIDVATGEHTVLVPQPAGAGDITHIDWSPDGEHLAIWYSDDAYIESPEGERDPNRYGATALYLADADGSGVRLLDRVYGDPNGWHGSPGENIGSAWSPDGSRLTYSTQVPATRRSVEIQVWTASTDGSPPTLLASQCCVPDGGGPVWSPDGSQIAFAIEEEDGSPALPTTLVANADGTGDLTEIDLTTYRSWQGGWFWCFCHG